MTRYLSLDEMQQRVGTLERRLAHLESAYMELLAMLAPLGGNRLAALSMAPRRYEQNLRNLLPAPSHRGRQGTGDRRAWPAGQAPSAAAPSGSQVSGPAIRQCALACSALVWHVALLE